MLADILVPESAECCDSGSLSAGGADVSSWMRAGGKLRRQL